MAIGYLGGSIGRQDFALACQWFQKAANRGHLGAQTMLGYQYEKGRGVPKDEKRAFELYSSAAARGYPEAMYNLGRLYQTGRGVPKNEAMSNEWYAKAAERGNKDAINAVKSRERFKTLSPQEKRFAKARGAFSAFKYKESARLFEQLASEGHVGAIAALGFQYEEGLGLNQNHKNAVDLYRRAAKQGHGGAQKALGQMYEDGKGVREDWAEALRWYKISAKGGNGEGQYALGRMYQFGMAVPQNRAIAREWFLKAAAQNVENARRFAEHLQSPGNCIGLRNDAEDRAFHGICDEPKGKTFENSVQRNKWLQARFAEAMARAAAFQAGSAKFNCALKGGVWGVSCTNPRTGDIIHDP